MKRLIALMLLLVTGAVSAADNVIETGPPRAADFVLGFGDVVTVSDSLATSNGDYWKGITSALVVNQSVTLPAEFGFYLRSGWVDFGIDPGMSIPFPVEFMPMARILSMPAGSKPDSVISCTSGAIRVYVFGG